MNPNKNITVFTSNIFLKNKLIGLLAFSISVLPKMFLFLSHQLLRATLPKRKREIHCSLKL